MLREKLALWIDDANTPYLLIDFTAIRKIDSSTLGMLLNAHAKASQKGTRIGLINVGKTYQELACFDAAGECFSVFPDGGRCCVGVGTAGAVDQRCLEAPADGTTLKTRMTGDSGVGAACFYGRF